MMRQACPCPRCGQPIQAHWQLFWHEPHCQELQRRHRALDEAIADRPPDVSAWTLEKATNRLHRKLAQIDRAVLRPKLAYALTGEAQREYQAAQVVLQKSVAAIEEARRPG
jgi:hypothetical protein